MSYKEYHKHAVNYTATLKKYCLIQKNVDSFHIAKIFIDTISEKALKDEDLRAKMLQWFNGKTGTIALKEILHYNTKFDWHNRAHFNAFAAMDSASIYYKNPEQFKHL